MSQENINWDDFLVWIGRADEGRTFVRVAHLSSGKSRIVVGIGDRTVIQIQTELARAILNELAEGMGFEPT
jgi:hypothetical protein